MKKFKAMEYEPLPIISKDFPRVVIPLIDSAMHSIDIVVFDWRFYPNDPANPVSLFNSALVRAYSRGVTVRCLVNSDLVLHAIRQLGFKVKKLESKRILHTKLLMVDRQKVIIGSHNYTQNAFSSNHEASIFVVLKDTSNGFVQYFENLFGL